MTAPWRIGLLTLALGISQAFGDTLVVESRKLFDGSRVIEQARLVIEDGRVVAVGPRGEVSLPDGARVEDLGEQVVIPGMIAAHSHVGMVSGLEHGGGHYTRENVLRDLRQYRDHGYTLVNALGLNAPLFHELRQAYRGAGHQGADLYGAGPGIGARGGVPPIAAMNLRDEQAVRPTTAEEGRQAVRNMAEQGVDLIKIWLQAGGEDDVKLPPEVYQAAIEQAHALGLRVAAHIHDLEDARAMVDAGVDIIAHGVRDQPVDKAFIQAMRDSDTWYIPTVNIDEAEYVYAEHPEWLEDPFFSRAFSQPLREAIASQAWRDEALQGGDESRRSVAMNIENLRQLHRGGVSIGFGTDSGATALRVPGIAEYLEMRHMASAGMTARQVLAAATRRSADMLGLEDRGSLQAGSVADFVVLSGDPLEDIDAIRSVEQVWRYGQREYQAAP
ncbi:amidohydrolase family protein [Stutzerimonas tarimensis]|uniref:Amidohydrolase family protein n=1 Tax=Stutzerimonas tarimensis TaxID=1507735 RepID=A0ABV7T4M7_9GAMM